MIEWSEKKFGKFSEYTLKRSLEKQGLKVDIVTYKATTKRTISFPVETIIAVSEGKYEIVLLGETYTLKPGNSLKIPKETKFDSSVIGKDDVIAFESTK